MTDEFRMSKLDIINNDLKQKRIWNQKKKRWECDWKKGYAGKL